jgi:hypothetical protein
VSHLRWQFLFEHRELIDSVILLFLGFYILSDRFFISTHRRNKVPSGPEILSHQVSLPSPERSRYGDGTLALDLTDYWSNSVFRRHRDQPVHMIDLQMSFFDLALFLRGQLFEDVPQMPTQLPLENFPATLKAKYNVVFTFPLGML